SSWRSGIACPCANANRYCQQSPLEAGQGRSRGRAQHERIHRSPAMSQARYSAARRRLHWLIFVALGVVSVLGEFGGVFERGTAGRGALGQGHFGVGLAIFALMLPRLLRACRQPAPPAQPPLPLWQAAPAKLIHLAVYALLL